MANPRTEDGHIDVPHELAEALMWVNLNSYQYRILWAIWRKTWGWHKKRDYIAVKQLCKMTGLKHGHVCRTLEELKAKNMIKRTSSGTRKGDLIEFQTNYDKWISVPNQVQSTSSGPNCTSSGTKFCTSSGDHKRNYTKETNKRTLHPDSLRLAGLLLELIQERDSRVKADLNKWAVYVNRLIKQGYKPDEIEAVIRWCQKDGNFWQSNILSTRKLWKDFSRLLQQMENDRKYYNNFRLPELPKRDWSL